MPKFISSSSGTYYAPDKLKQDEDEILAVLKKQDGANDAKKPSAVNKKGTKEKQKSNLDLFKEELRRLNEEQEEQRNRVKNSLDQAPSPSSTQTKPKAPVPVPLLPDPRCPTSLTLKVNLNPRDKDAPSAGSFDTGDPTTTNLYIGNLNPTVTENDLCDIFGRFGPLASIKIMWPRTDEERARNRNSGFVAYMSRIDGERAFKVLNGMEYKGYDMKLGWGKAVPLPKNPVFIPKELLKSLQPPPKSGLPFNAQLHPDDVNSGYNVPKPIPRPFKLNTELHADQETSKEEIEYREFLQVFQRATVRVCVPQDRALLDKIHKTIEFVIREGPVFESIITARESKNHEYSFIYEYNSLEHVYYRWKLYSMLHGDDPHLWSTDDFRMYEGGPLWRPPALNPFADGMQLELVEKLTGVSKDALLGNNSIMNAHKFINIDDKCDSSNAPRKCSLDAANSKNLQDNLSCLKPTKSCIGSVMLFCINHAYAAAEIIDKIKDSISQAEISMTLRLAHLYLISDILNNSSAAVTNASYYREGFRAKLDIIFSQLSDNLQILEDAQQAKRYNQKILDVLGAWKYYQLYEDEFVLKLGRSFSGAVKYQNDGTGPVEVPGIGTDSLDDDLDGYPIDESTLAECLERKGLSLRWYKTLELSDDEDDVESQSPQTDNTPKLTNASPKGDSMDDATKETLPRERFKVSKWELVTDEKEPSSMNSASESIDCSKTLPTEGEESSTTIDKSSD